MACPSACRLQRRCCCDWSLHRWQVATFLERAAELHERYAPRGLVIYGVAYDEEPAGLRKFLSTNALPFEVVVGTDATYRNFKIAR